MNGTEMSVPWERTPDEMARAFKSFFTFLMGCLLSFVLGMWLLSTGNEIGLFVMFFGPILVLD